MASNRRVRISSGKTNLPEASNVCRVLLTINAVARNILSVQGTKLYAQKYVLAWELYQWAMNASENNQEGNHHRRILRQTELALHSLPRKHR